MKFTNISIVLPLIFSSSIYAKTYGEGTIENCILYTKRSWSNGSLSSYQPVKGIQMIVEEGKDAKIKIGGLTVKYNKKLVDNYLKCNR